METINKNILAKSIAKQLGIKTATIKNVINSFLDQIREEYRKGNRIELREFGTFYAYNRKPRSYKTELKETKKMSAKKILKFKCSRHLHL
jgi:nucleoid DNA-binding protein